MLQWRLVARDSGILGQYEERAPASDLSDTQLYFRAGGVELQLHPRRARFDAGSDNIHLAVHEKEKIDL
jgi:hypothetical protein